MFNSVKKFLFPFWLVIFILSFLARTHNVLCVNREMNDINRGANCSNVPSVISQVGGLLVYAAVEKPQLFFNTNPSLIQPGNNFDLNLDTNPNGSQFYAFELYFRYDPNKVDFQHPDDPEKDIISSYPIIAKSVDSDAHIVKIVGTRMGNSFSGFSRQNIAVVKMKVRKTAKGNVDFNWIKQTKIGSKIERELLNSSFGLSGEGKAENPTTTEDLVVLNLKIKFLGISARPKDYLNQMDVLVSLIEKGGNDMVTKTVKFTADDKAVWSGRAVFAKVVPKQRFKLYLKGPKHIPIEKEVFLDRGDNDIDLSNIPQLPGDLPLQDGVINSYDLSLIRNNLGNSQPEIVGLADLNLDGIVDSQDYSLVIRTLSRLK